MAAPWRRRRRGNTQAYETNQSGAAIISRVTRRRLHRKPRCNEMDAGARTNALCARGHTHRFFFSPTSDEPISAPLRLTVEDYFAHARTQRVEYVLCCSALVHTVPSRSSRAFPPKSTDMYESSEGFFPPSATRHFLFIVLGINTNRVDERVDVGTNACLRVTFH